MERDPKLQADRFDRFCADVLEPAAVVGVEPLGVEAFVSVDAVEPGAAREGPFQPVRLGWEWGPAWATAWFRLRGRVPDRFEPGAVGLRFDTGVEALLRLDGVPFHGFDANRDTALVPFQPGDPVDVLVEAACNHPFGVEAFAWDSADTHRRWRGPRPARLERAELVALDHRARELATAYAFASALLRELRETDPRSGQLIDALHRAGAAFGADPGARDQALDIVKGALSVPAPGSATRCIAVGHAHLDTAWLWPVRETRRKCLRSFTNVLRLMERFPDFRFLCSQAQQYAFVEEDAPEVFDQIARRVREGRWEPGGAMWVEPDANCPSGESLVRQILHGTRYWEDRFGPAGRQRFLFLPDTFGFPASLPQIIAAAGLDTFITNKLAWNPVNRYPDTSFRWRGIDGAEVNAHLTPGADYNAVNTPRELRRGESRHASTHIPGVEGAARWLQPFGYGDGGGGPTDRSVAYAELAADCDGLPRVSLGRADQFCAALEADFQALRARGGSPPVWDGELYLDLHRGTLTTQAWLKRANRRAEELLALAEMVTVAAPGESLSECRHADGLVRAALDRAWKLVLLNQFHDILPGSSIAAVYEDARRDHEEVRALLEPIADAGLARWARTLGGPIVVNPTGADRRAVVEVGGRLHLIDRIPAHGARLLSEPEAPSRPVRVERGRVLDNGILRAEIGPGGGVNSLLHLPTGREAAAGQPLNRLALYQDHPRMWDAWDIDPEAETLPVSDVGAPDSVEVVREDPLRAEIRVSRRLGERSRVEQVYRLDAESPRLDVVTTVEWREDHRLLRALFPVAVRARDATYDIQFGSLTRPTHRNTPWDRARFEVCAHRWMDLSEPGFGVALLNDGKYGHSCFGSVMGLTLLRAPTWPDPDADRGEHRFTYALMPHAGDWRRAGVDAEAQALNTPPFHHHHATSQAGLAQTWSPFTLEARGPAALRVEALKPAEDGRGAILRLVEFHGGTGEVDLLWTDPPTRAEPADLLERPASSGPAACAVGHDPAARRTRLSARPFGLITLRFS